MGETIHVERVGRTPTTAVELVHSPDDGGYYLSNADFQKRRGRVSAKVYKTRAAAIKDWNAGTVEWEAWNG
jgi:hypothetical protein